MPFTPLSPAPSSAAIQQQLAALLQQRRAPGTIGAGIHALGGDIGSIIASRRMAAAEAEEEQRQLAALLGLPEIVGSPGQPAASGVGPPTAPTPGAFSPETLKGLVASGAAPALMQAVIGQRFAAPRAGVEVDGSLVDPVTGKVVYAGTPKQDLSTTEKEARALGFNLGTPEGAQSYADWRQNLTRPPAAPVVNLPAGEREGQVLAARFVDQVETEKLPALRRQLNQVGQIEALFDEGLETGKAAELLSSLSNTLGIEIDPNASKLEAARSLINGIITSKIGEATFGALSEGERTFLAGITADVSITPEANKRRLDIAKKVLKYEAAVAREASRYADDRGTTAGLDAHLDGWAASNPLVTDKDLRSAPEPGDTTGGIAEGTIATNPQTGQSLIRRAGKWAPL